MLKKAQKPFPKVNTPMLSKNLLSVLLHLSSLILSPHSVICLAETERPTKRSRDREILGWCAGCLDWCRRMWRALSSLIFPLFLLACLLHLSRPVYQSVHQTQTLHSSSSLYAVFSIGSNTVYMIYQFMQLQSKPYISKTTSTSYMDVCWGSSLEHNNSFHHANWDTY